MIGRVILAMVGVLLMGGLYEPRVAATAPTAQSAESRFSAKFRNRLVILGDDGKLHDYNSARLAGVKYLAYYYSASWCAPCRVFTPELIKFYRDFKAAHPDFELIFVNMGHSEADMAGYMKTDATPWPAIKFSDLDDPELADVMGYCSEAIPCLVLLNGEGKVLTAPFHGDDYTNPHLVIDAIRSKVR
jgi:nucleoredoxin